jgi:D-alanine-D-alanine ligase-like ATP-grasp enzyme
MKITVALAATYILDCCLIGTKPCKYFQTNAPYFNEKKGVFSKMDLDKLTPEPWRLMQRYDDGVFVPRNYPVFLKPEWGENAAGIFRADDLEQLTKYRQQVRDSDVPYLLQECALESKEFEIFAMRDSVNKENYSVLSVTAVENAKESNPVNGINNPDTEYVDVTDQLTNEQRKTLWGFIEQMGEFGISRLSVRADSIEDLLKQDFHAIEINLFTPFPIHMLDKKYSNGDKAKMVWDYMMKLAKLTRGRDKTRIEKPIYTKMMFYNRPGRLAKFIREYI